MMKTWLQIEPDGRVVASLETEGDMTGVPGMIEGPESAVGKRHVDGDFVDIPKTEKELAAEKLAEIDAKTGMSRLLRETLISMAGAAAPKTLTDAEAEAAINRGKLTK